MPIRPLFTAFCTLSILAGPAAAQFKYQFEESSTGEILALLELSTLPASETSHIQSFQILERVGESPFEFYAWDVASTHELAWITHSVESPIHATKNEGLTSGEFHFSGC